MSRKSLLFFAKAPMNVVMIRPLVERLRDDERLALRFAAKPDLGLSPRALFDQGGLPGVKIWPRPWAALRRPDLYLSPDMMLLARRARCAVQLYHGVSFKGRMYSEKVLAYNKLFLVGEDMRRRYVERGILQPDDPRIEKIGMPKTDRLLNGTLDREAVLRGLRLDPARKTVLYAPTWRPESSLYSMGRELMRDLGALPVNLLVKLHDLAFDPAANPVNWNEELPKIERENVRAVRDVDIVPAMFASDVLISDASSVANEYTLLDRPILFIDTPELFEVYKETIDLSGWGRKTGSVAASMDELKAALQRAFDHPEENGEIRRAAAADLFYNPGCSTEAAVEAAYRILSLPRLAPN